MKVKYTITILFIFLNFVIYAQSRNVVFSIEYSPNISRLSTTPTLVDYQWKLSHNIFFKTEYQLSNEIRPTFGIGFFNTGDQFTSEVGSLGIDKIRYKYHFNYILIPMGISWNIGSYYVNPEIGLGLNISNVATSKIYFLDGSTEKSSMKYQLYGGEFNKITIPVMMSIGRTITIKTMEYLIGLKGYYGLNQIVKDVPNTNHYYGFGLNLGVRF